MKITRTVIVTRVRREVRLKETSAEVVVRCPHCGGELPVAATTAPQIAPGSISEEKPK